MRPVVTLALAAALALPAAAQVIPDEFPDPSEGFADRAQRELVERHRPFLSGLYAQSTLAVGPAIGEPTLVGLAATEGGYRFESGNAVAIATTLRTPLAVSPVTGAPEYGLTGAVGAEFVVALGRGADRASVLRGAEVGLGAGVSVYESLDGIDLYRPTLSVAPRVAIPLSPTTALPVGLRLTQEVAGDARGLHVGLSIGLRRIWADDARMVLE